MKLLVTGATGFLGQRLVSTLQALPAHELRCALRQAGPAPLEAKKSVVVGDISPHTDWTTALANIDVVIHLAARVHVVRDTERDPLASFLRTNTEATLHLARQAAQAGVRRLVFLSSVKVNGERTPRGRPFAAQDPARPEDAYGISKHRAEAGLHEIAVATGMEIVVIRPPLVYGPGVKANFASLVRAVERGLPLPLGAIDNRRSLVALDNLVDLIVTCLDHPAAAGHAFLVSDGEDLSIAELVRRLGHALQRPARLLPVPVWALRTGAALLGKAAVAQRLCDNLQVDISATRERLGWTPPLTVDEGLRRAVQRPGPP